MLDSIRNTVLRKSNRFYSVINNKTRECFVKNYGKFRLKIFVIKQYNIDNGLAKIVLNRPKKMNSLGRQILRELKECILAVSDKRQ